MKKTRSKKSRDTVPLRAGSEGIIIAGRYSRANKGKDSRDKGTIIARPVKII